MTLEETYNRIISSEDLRNRYEGITDAKSLEGFLEELGCRETSETFMKSPLPPLDWRKY